MAVYLFAKAAVFRGLNELSAGPGRYDETGTDSRAVTGH